MSRTKKLKRVLDVALLAYTVGRAAGIRLAVGRWDDDGEPLPLAGRTKDPKGVWLRMPRSTSALIIFRGRGSTSPEAERERSMVVGVAEADEGGPVLGTPRVIQSDPEPIDKAAEYATRRAEQLRREQRERAEHLRKSKPQRWDP